MVSGSRPYSHMNINNVSMNSVATKVHIDNQELEIGRSL